MRSNGYTLQIACCASCTPRKENSPLQGLGGWVHQKSPPLSPFGSEEPRAQRVRTIGYCQRFSRGICHAKHEACERKNSLT